MNIETQIIFNIVKKKWNILKLNIKIVQAFGRAVTEDDTKNIPTGCQYFVKQANKYNKNQQNEWIAK